MKTVDAISRGCDVVKTLKGWNRLREASIVEDLMVELLRANSEAESLALAIFRRHHAEEYAKEGLNWELCDSVAGIITQIDNMVAGLNGEIVKLQAENQQLIHELEVQDREGCARCRIQTARSCSNIVKETRGQYHDYKARHVCDLIIKKINDKFLEGSAT